LGRKRVGMAAGKGTGRRGGSNGRCEGRIDVQERKWMSVILNPYAPLSPIKIANPRSLKLAPTRVLLQPTNTRLVLWTFAG